MKILLIYPYCLENRLHVEDIRSAPIGIYYIGAVLKAHRYDVDILNWHNMGQSKKNMEAILSSKNPDIIGFSILQANRWGGIEIAKIAKKINPEVKIIFGGISPTFLWKHFLTHFKEIDFIVMGEGEYTFLKLVKYVEQNNIELDQIKGIAFRKKDKVIRTPKAELIKDLDKLPNPSQYFSYQHLSLSRGCPGKCSFCGSPKFWGNKIRFHSTTYFVKSIEHLVKKGITFFYFSDDTFTMDKNRVIELCQKIINKKLKITWVAISRVSYVSAKMLFWMRKAGCIQISYGIESGSKKIRNYLNKKIGISQVKKAFHLTLYYGILARAYFIYGCPGETDDTIQETQDLIHSIKPLSIIFYILDIFPGTFIYEEFKKKFNVTDDIWLDRIEDILYFETDKTLSKELILGFGKKLRETYYTSLPEFAYAIQVIDEKELYPFHSDFFSRLGMTFSQGDYSKIESIQGKDMISEHLYQRALEYYPDTRSFLGLGIIKQKQGAFEKSVKILSKGISYFPNNHHLNICLGISYMNLNEYEKALSIFAKFKHIPQVKEFISACQKAL